jgi:uncharacterized protein (DUF924 family)
MMAAELPARARALIDFWFGPPDDPERENHRQIWFKSTPEYDAALRRLFLTDYEEAAAGALAAWEAVPESALALLLLLDQIPRNIFRASPRAYATDALAREIADRALERGFDQHFPFPWRKFFYLPFHHSEDLADQRRSVVLFASVRDERDPDDREESGGLRRYGRPYVEVIERFGRFPHRNAILGRVSTPEELAFLEDWRRRSQETERPENTGASVS